VNSKNQFMLGTIVLVLLLMVGWSYLHLSQSRDAAMAAAEDLTNCRTLVKQIVELRRRPSIAGTQELAVADLSRRIEQAALTARFPQENIERIDPEPARRVGESNYRQLPTLIRLRHVTLQQIFTFLHTLASDDSNALQLQQIRLSAPRGEETSDRWTIESTLAYTIYSPQKE
jgi:hypothetical protein